MRVTLIAYSRPGGFDPRRLVVLAAKVSSGRVREKGWEHYFTGYPEDDVAVWLVKATGFPSVLEHVTFTFLVEGDSRVSTFTYPNDTGDSMGVDGVG